MATKQTKAVAKKTATPKQKAVTAKAKTAPKVKPKTKSALKAKAKPKASPKPKAKPKAQAQAVTFNALLASLLPGNAIGKAAGATAGTRRPPNNPEMKLDDLKLLIMVFSGLKETLEKYAAHLRALDRKRLNGVGIKKQGFIERALAYAAENPEFLPHYLSLGKFKEDGEYYLGYRNLTAVVKEIQELAWNITIEASDVWYTDGLEFYASVREASKRRVDPAETIYNDLEVFFKHQNNANNSNK